MNDRFRIDEKGCLEIIDPGHADLELLQTIAPKYRIQEGPLQGFSLPRFQSVRRRAAGISKTELAFLNEETLWDLHKKAMADFRQGNPGGRASGTKASLLDLKIELCRKILAACRLCGRKCGINRLKGERGICGLGIEGIVTRIGEHIAEEPPINPSILVNLAGCGLQCKFCQKGLWLQPENLPGKELQRGLWKGIATARFRSLSFIGGNPDESLFAILRFLREAPRKWGFPVVWNSNGYSTSETLTLLDGIVDVFLPDFKFGNQKCGLELAEARDYHEIAKKSLQMMLAQEIPVICRILVLPGHSVCCHNPALDFLAKHKNRWLEISIRGQYFPSWKTHELSPEMRNRATTDEIAGLVRFARSKEIPKIWSFP